MQYFRFVFLPILFLGIHSIIVSQSNTSYYPQPEHPEWFKAIPMVDETTPQWAITMYTDDTNFELIESQKYTFYKKNQYVKNIHIQNYKYWMKIVRDHINDEGRVQLLEPGEEFLAYEPNKKQSPQKSAGVWSNIGPYETVNFNNGVAEARPTQANIYSLGVSPSNPNVAYAGAETGGIFKTTDKGLNWFPVTESYAIGSMGDVKVDPLDENIVYGCRGSELYKTTDGGSTWSLHHVFSATIEQLYIYQTDTDTIYAATADGVYKSIDAGSSWVSKFSGRCYDIEAKPGTDTVMYIAVNSPTYVRPEIYKTIDAGDTWTLIDNGYYMPSVPSESTVYGCKIGVTPADPNRIYAGIIASGKAGDNGWIGIYYSLDEGASWQEDSGFDGGPYASGSDASTNWYVAGYSSGYHQGFYNFDLDVSHNNPDKLWVGTIWFCESGNKGGNIEYIRGTRNLNMHADIQDIDVLGNDIWIASDGGINFSDDECQTVSTRMKGIYAADYWGFGQGWNEDVCVGGRYHNGNAALHENYGTGNSIFLGGAENATGYVNPRTNRKNYYSDVGAKLIPQSFSSDAANLTDLGMYPTESYFHFNYSEVEWHPYYSNVVYVGRDNMLHRSTDEGISFSSLYTFPNKIDGGTSYEGLVRRFEISRDDPSVIYALVRYTTYIWRVFRSSDGGSTFTELPLPPYSSGSFRDLSFGLNPFNKDEIWLAANSSNNGNKIFSSTDGGTTWTNRYSSVIADEAIKDVIYQASNDGDQVYIMTNDNYYFFDVDLGDWTQWNSGLPVLHRGFMSLPFYRDNKIRMASAKGIWEAEMNNPSKVQAIPMSNTDSVFCSRDTISLESFSIVEHNGTTWQWTISPTPQWISDASARNPQVILGQEGSFDVSLTITDANNQTDTRLVSDMIHVDNRCVIDSVAGQSLHTFSNDDYMVIPDANLSNVTHFTVTGWWKPNGAQSAYAALFSSGDWCAHCEYTEGLIFDYDGNKLWYKWPGDGNPWASDSGIEVPLDEWSYVALVITPEGATMYLNEEKYVHSRVLSPGEISSLYIGKGHYSKAFQGEIDEVTMWNRALTDDEIYRMRHITKEEEIANDPDLLAYYQFNELVHTTEILDMAGTLHGTLSTNAEINSSSVPVGKGKAELITLDPVVFDYNFMEPEVALKLSDCENISGKMVVTRIDVDPDEKANSNLDPGNYWIFNQYETAFPSIDSLSLTPSSPDFVNVSSAAQTVSHTRSANAEGSTWMAKSYANSFVGNAIIYDRKIALNTGSQLSLTQNASSFTEIDPGNPCEADTIPGNLLTLPGNSGDYVEVPAMNLGTNTFTFSAWVKSDGLQNSWAAIFFSRAGTTTAGLSCANGDNELRYHWNGGEYQWSSGLYLPVDEWAHVAWVVEPDKVTIYLNGVASIRNDVNAEEAFDGLSRIGNDPNSGTRTFQGEIDEVCIWNKALNMNEIRLLRHLTKEQEVNNDPDLKLYLQFNEDQGKAYDKAGSRLHSTFKGNTSRTHSPVPVGSGSCELLTVNSAGTYASTTGIDLTFGASGTYPDGDLVLTRIHLQPNLVPPLHASSKHYWVINNYGTNPMFTALTDMKFYDIGNTTPITLASTLSLQSREDNGIDVWQKIVAGNVYNAATEDVEFLTSLTTFGQFTITNSTGKAWIGELDTDWDETGNWNSGLIPGDSDHVVIPGDTPFQPILNLDVTLKSINLMPGASLKVPLGILFSVDQ